MSQSNEENSRSNRNQNRKSDRLANWLIAAVIVGLFITGWIVLSPEKQAEPGKEEQEGPNDQVVEEDEIANEEDELDEPDEENLEEESALDEVEIIEGSTDEFVKKSMVDPTWKPIGTTQSGEHVSLYDGTSVDWKEKEQALLYATGLTEDNVIFWKIKNGGGPQQAIGIVSSMDQVEKYRVHLEWLDGEGWQPVQLDELHTLEFDF